MYLRPNCFKHDPNYGLSGYVRKYSATREHKSIVENRRRMSSVVTLQSSMHQPCATDRALGDESLFAALRFRAVNMLAAVVH